MSTHHDLWIAARARMNLIELEIAAMQQAPKGRSVRRALLMARLMHRLSALLLEAGSRLERYADRSLARARGKRWEEGVANPC